MVSSRPISTECPATQNHRIQITPNHTIQINLNLSMPHSAGIRQLYTLQRPLFSIPKFLNRGELSQLACRTTNHGAQIVQIHNTDGRQHDTLLEGYMRSYLYNDRVCSTRLHSLDFDADMVTISNNMYV